MSPWAGRHLWSRGAETIVGESLDGQQYYFEATNTINDDLSGQVTGTGSSPITKPAAIWHHFALLGGFGMVGSDFETTATTFGSFREATSYLNSIVTGNSWDIICRVLEPTTPQDLAERICQQTPMDIWRSMHDGKFKCAVYKTAPETWEYFTDHAGAVHYWDFHRDMRDVSVSFTPIDECVNEVHVKYALFSPTGTYLRDCWVGPSGSDDGTGTRDQNSTTPDDRETVAGDCRDDYAIKASLIIEADMIYLDDVALAMRNYLFDRYCRPRMLVTFKTGARAVGLEPCMYTRIADLTNDYVRDRYLRMQDHIPCPYYAYGSNPGRAWGDMLFFVRSLSRESTMAGDTYTVTLEEVA